MIIVRQPNKLFHFLLFCCVFALFFGISFWSGAGRNKAILTGSLEASASNAVEIAAPEEIQPVEIETFPNIQAGVRAQAALVMWPTGEQTGRILYDQNKDKKLPIASLTKLMTALIALEQLDLNQKTLVSKNAMAQEGVQGALKEGETLSVRNLLFISLIESSNRAAYALSEIMGVENFIAAMNERAQALGMANTSFADSTGLSKSSYSSAQDIAMLTQYLFETQPLFKEIIGYKTYGLYIDGIFHHTLENTNKMLGENYIIGGKTGWTTEARGCFVAIQQYGAGDYQINVILGAEDRFLEMNKLINTANQ